MHTYTVRVGPDDPVTFANQADAWGAANDIVIQSEGNVVTALEKLTDLGVHGQAILTDGRLIAISVADGSATSTRERGET